jgi:hypothetical protein
MMCTPLRTPVYVVCVLGTLPVWTCKLNMCIYRAYIEMNKCSTEDLTSYRCAEYHLFWTLLFAQAFQVGSPCGTYLNLAQAFQVGSPCGTYLNLAQAFPCGTCNSSDLVCLTICPLYDIYRRMISVCWTIIQVPYMNGWSIASQRWQQWGYRIPSTPFPILEQY